MEAKKSSVIGFTPIPRPESSIRFTPLSEAETPEQMIDRFVETLNQQGFIELKVPNRLKGRIATLYLVKRQAKNPGGPIPALPKRGHYVHLPIGHNYDTAMSLTLAGVNSKGEPVALGYRDYKIFDTPRVANGDMGVDKTIFSAATNLPPEIASAVALSDSRWPGTFINGVEISKDFQAAGLARLLVATASLILHGQGINAIELGGDKTKTSDQVMGIYNRLRRSDHPTLSNLDLNYLDHSAIQKAILNFLK